MTGRARQSAEAGVASRVEKFIDDSNPRPSRISPRPAAGHRVPEGKEPRAQGILIFSDMKETWPRLRAQHPARPEGFDVVALNVTKLRTDNFDPANTCQDGYVEVEGRKGAVIGGSSTT